MLQRIQSLWLLLAATCAFISLKVPYYSGTNHEGIPSYKLLGTENFYLMLLTIAVAVLALITIFLYKNRTLQLRLCILGILLEALLIFLYYLEVKKFSDGTYSLTALLHGLIVLFFFLAARGINNDNKIIRDSNRLR
jgi:heme/copper-type cytochrome/quinol oxidase subunit 4